ALKNEREIRIAIHEGEIKAILELANISSPVVGDGAPEPKYDLSKLNESDWQKLINSFGNLRQLNYSPTQVGVSTTSFDAVKKVCSDVVNTQLEALEIIKETVEKVGEPFRDANLNIPSEAGQEIVVDAVVRALWEKGYAFLASSITAPSLFGATGAFDPKNLGDPTDVARLLWKQGEEFIEEKKGEIWQINSNLNPNWTFEAKKDASQRLEISVNQAIEDYLTSIKYANDYKVRLVFPDVKFDFEKYMRGDYWVEKVVPKQ
ncbi:MAG: hypothetical protein AB1422_07325, partial [bacterium]